MPAVFSFDSHAIRTLTDEHGNPLFCAPDVCEVLGYTNPSKSIKDHCVTPGVTKRYIGVTTGKRADGSNATQQVETTFITEGNLYRLIVRSHKQEAVRFEKWLMDEVLPTIRQTGSYSLSGITNSDTAHTLSPWALTHNGLPVLTVQRLAACFGLTASTIQNYSRQHASQLLENTHYFLLTGEAQRHFRLDNRSSPDTPCRKLPVLTLWTEAGAQQLAQCISPTFATQAMPAVRRYLYAAAPAPAQPDTVRPTLVTPPDGSRLLLSTDRHGNIQSEPVPLDAFVVRREELAARIAARDEIWTRAELAAILTAAANRLAG